MVKKSRKQHRGLSTFAPVNTGLGENPGRDHRRRRRATDPSKADPGSGRTAADSTPPPPPPGGRGHPPSERPGVTRIRRLGLSSPDARLTRPPGSQSARAPRVARRPAAGSHRSQDPPAEPRASTACRSGRPSRSLARAGPGEGPGRRPAPGRGEPPRLTLPFFLGGAQQHGRGMTLLTGLVRRRIAMWTRVSSPFRAPRHLTPDANPPLSHREGDGRSGRPR